MKRNAIIAKLRDGLDNVKTVHLGDMTVGLKVLRHSHYHEANLVVSGFYQERGIKVGMHNIDEFEIDKENQYLLNTVVDLETGEPLFESVEELRELLHNDKRKQLLDEAEAFQEECSPTMSKYTDEEFEKLFEEVKKTPNPATLNVLNLYTLRKLVLTLASQPKT